MTGKLEVTVVEARLTRDTEMFGNMDPFIMIESRMQRIRTEVCKNGGKEPKWPEEKFVIDVKYVGDDMAILVLDQNVTDTDSIGKATIKLSAMCCDGGLDEWYAIAHKGKHSGDVHMISKWIPDGEDLEEPPEDPPEPPVVQMTSGAPAPPVAIPPYYQQQPQYYAVAQPQPQVYPAGYTFPQPGMGYNPMAQPQMMPGMAPPMMMPGQMQMQAQMQQQAMMQ
jgi:hypothetical protein